MNIHYIYGAVLIKSKSNKLKKCQITLKHCLRNTTIGYRSSLASPASPNSEIYTLRLLKLNVYAVDRPYLVKYRVVAFTCSFIVVSCQWQIANKQIYSYCQ